MNNPESEVPADVPAESTAAPAPAPAPQFDAKRRLRELLSVPERDRTDEQWDEIIELEIQTAPGNRVAPGELPGSGAPRQGQSHSKPGGGGGGNNNQKKHRPRSGNNRRPRQNKPQSGGGSQG